MTTTFEPRRALASNGDHSIASFVSSTTFRSISRRFIVTSLVFLGLAGLETLGVLWQLAYPDGSLLSPSGFAKLSTLQGTTMVFLFAIPFMVGLIVAILPGAIGASGTAAPRLVTFGYWTYLLGALVFYASLAVADVSAAGMFAPATLSGPIYSPSHGVDYWSVGVGLACVGAVAAAIAAIVSVWRLRRVGMSLSDVPVVAWGAVSTSVLLVVSLVPFVVGIVFLELDRVFNTSIYDPSGGGLPDLWNRLASLAVHPELIVLPFALGIVSHVLNCDGSGTRWGRALTSAGLLSFAVVAVVTWLVSMAVIGADQAWIIVRSVGGIALAIPVSLAVLGIVGTIWARRPAPTPDVCFSIGFLVVVTVAGATEVLGAVPPITRQFAGTAASAGALYAMLFAATVFAGFAASFHWLPSLTGRAAGRRGGIVSFALVSVGATSMFVPMYFLGADGMPWGTWTYSAASGWQPLNAMSAVGGVLLALGVGLGVATLALGAIRGPAVTTPVHGWLPGSADTAVITTPVRATAYARATLPHGSLAPLLLALGVAVTVVAALLGAYWVAAAGTALTLGAAVAWPLNDARRRDERNAAVAPDDGLEPAGVRIGVSVAWLVLLVGVIVQISILAAYVYLWVVDDVWPPLTQDYPPQATWPTVAVALVLLATLLAAITAFRWRRGRVFRPGWLFLAAGAVLGLAAGIIVAGPGTGLTVPATTDAYTALAATLVWWSIAVVSAAIFVALIAAVVAAARPAAMTTGWAAIATALWCLAALVAVSAWVVMIFVPVYVDHVVPSV